MAGKESATDLYKLEQEVAALKTQLERAIEMIQTLDAELYKVKIVTDAVKPLAKTFGVYRESGGSRKSMALMTAAYPTAGIIDVMVLDSSYSGGFREDAGIEVGTGKREFMPFLVEDEPEEVETKDDTLVAAKS
jgi:hypothetical protein